MEPVRIQTICGHLVAAGVSVFALVSCHIRVGLEHTVLLDARALQGVRRSCPWAGAGAVCRRVWLLPCGPRSAQTLGVPKCRDPGGRTSTRRGCVTGS